MLPDDYIGSTTEKMKLYRQLNNLTEEEQLQDFEKMLEDRFGPVPAPAQALTEVVRLRHAAMQLAIERIILRQDTFLAVFVSDRNSSFYSSDLFRRILMFIQQKPLHFRLKEKNDKLTLTVPRVKSIRAALRLLQEMNDKIIE